MIHKVTALITGVGAGGIGEGIVKALKLVKERYRIICTDTVALAAPLFRVDKGYLVPLAIEENYIDRLLDICKKENVDVLIPGSVPELDRISKDREYFESDDIVPILNPAEVIETGLDKWKTYEFLSENGFQCPQTVLAEDRLDLVERAGFPLLVKPRSSYGSRGIFLAQNVHDLDFFVGHLSSQGYKPLVQEYLGLKGQEYTTGVVVSKDGYLSGSISIWRKRKGGFSHSMIVDDFKNVRENAEAIATKIGARGAINVQVMKVEEDLFTLEINPRFSGTTPIRAACGFNEVDAVLRNFMFSEKIPTFVIKKKAVVRFLDEVYIEQHAYKSLTMNGFTDDQGEILSYM